MNWLETLRHELPQQAPLKDFIHHNTLHAYLSLPFDQAVATAGAIVGARAYLSLAEFRALYNKGRITEWAVEQALENAEPTAEKRSILRAELFDAAEPEITPRAFPYRLSLKKNHGVDLDQLAHPTVIRYISAFLDQGVAILRPVGADQDFWGWLKEIEASSFVPIVAGLSGEAKRVLKRLLLNESPESIIQFCLTKLSGGGSSEVQDEIALESALSLPGWSGMVSVVELKPKILYERRSVSLVQFMAFKLLVEWVVLLTRVGGEPSRATTRLAQHTGHIHNIEAFAKWRLHRIWQEAYETSSMDPYLKAMAKEAKAVAARGQARKNPPKVQAIFCLDEREGSLRRHLEELSPHTDTFGAAGFFGLDCEFKSLQDQISIQQCPAPMTPRYLIEERPQDSNHAVAFKNPLPLPYRGAVRTTLGGWAYSLFGAAHFVYNLLSSIWREQSHERSHVISIEDNLSDVLVFRSEFKSIDSDLMQGFEISEAADRAEKLLRELGMVKEFAPMVAFVAHGSQNANNAHFAAYDCGACSGKPGALNAKAIAKMLNSPELRGELARRGIQIPASTYFVGSYHDTCTDELVVMDKNRVPATHQAVFTEWVASMEKALARNAFERCRRFETGPRPKDAKAAANVVRQRASAIYEPRPELGHATNAFCIISRREMTKSLCWDRRAFHVSYDPVSDTTGKYLLGLLSAAIPVCGGINLEYYFSRVDSGVYGAGSKLPHNVNSLLGVSNGSIGDLRPGLPWQMVDFHEPIRLVMVLEQKHEIVEALMNNNRDLFEWITNRWIHLYTVDPDTGEVMVWGKKGEAGFKSFEGNQKIPEPVLVSSWLEVCGMGPDPLPVLKWKGGAL